MLVVGTVVGAGFASGREIVAFFGETPPALVPPICAALVFCMCAVFLFLGKKANGSAAAANALVAGKFAPAVSVVMIFNSAISLAAMLAAFDSLFSLLFPCGPLPSILFAALSAAVVMRGMGALVKSNAALVPLLMAVIAAVALRSAGPGEHSAFTAFTAYRSLGYVAMNMLLAANVLTGVKNLSAREIVLSSLVAALVLGAMMSLIVTALCASGAGKSELPLLSLAEAFGPATYFVAFFAVAAGIFTTMLTAHRTLTDWLAPAVKSRAVSALVTAGVCLALGFAGFRNIVDYAYPVVGAVGLIYFALSAAHLLRGVTRGKFLQKAHPKVHKPRQQAQNDG